MRYGELIKERRTVLGLTQQDLSDYTELSLRIIKSVESEEGNPSLKTLEKIGRSFQDSLVMHHLPPYKIIVSSVLRTGKHIKKLSRRNVNASKNSAHCYATTFDITYKRFQPLTDAEEVPQIKLKLVLGEVLRDLKKQGRCYVKHEVKQACFHITAR